MTLARQAGRAVDVAAAASGLTSAEVEAARHRDGWNRLPNAEQRTAWRIAWQVATQPMLLLLAAAASLYAMLGEASDAAMLAASVLVIAGLSFYQQRRTERVLSALKDLANPRCTVLRDGQFARISSLELVCGDWLIVNEGDRLAADARVTESSGLSVDESLLTGESVPVAKPAAGAQLYAGSLVVQGDGRAIVTAIGANTALGRIGGSLAHLQAPESRLQSELRHLVQRVAWLALITCLLAATLYAWREGSWTVGLLAGLTLAMSLIPEEFAVVWSVMLALGAWRLSHLQVLTRQPQAIETLGSVTVLCVDKTGTLTRNHMTLTKLFDGSEVTARELTSDTALLRAARRASTFEGIEPMDRALFEAAPLPAQVDSWAPGPRAGVRSGKPYVSRWWQSPHEGWLVFVKGAPEAVLARCDAGDPLVRKLQERAQTWSAEGLRVLAVAQGALEQPVSDGEAPSSTPLQAVGLLGFSDPLRDEVPAAVAQCRSAGIRVLMITGDSAATAGAIARQAGLGFASDHGVVSGDALARMSDTQLQEAVQSACVYARVTPDQKLRIVQALQHNGEVVAMTGDGVNDAPALRAAHIGVAMGKRGTDVAREAAALVLLDDNFASLVHAVRGGRRIFVNLQKALGYLFAVHIPIVALALVPVLMGGPALLLPLHVVLLELIIDPACSLVFEAEAERADCMQTPPRAATARLFGRQAALRALTVGAVAAACVLAAQGIGHLRQTDDNALRLLSLSSIVTVNLAMLAWFRGLRSDHDHANAAFDALLLGIAVAWVPLVAWAPAAHMLGFPEEVGPHQMLALSLSAVWASIALWRWSRRRLSSRLA